MRKKFTKGINNMVVKVGTSVLTRTGRFDKKIILSLSSQIACLLKKGIKISVVSSGAIGAGMTTLNLKKRPETMQGLQAAAAVGQRYLMQCYEEAFSRRGYSTAQVLLTRDDLAVSKRALNAQRTLRQIQDWGLVPIINENDTVATDEIRFGDNDRLSGLLAVSIKADCLVILQDVGGLYTDGQTSVKSQRIRFVKKIDQSHFSHVKENRNRFTVGGMGSKLKAVKDSVDKGIRVFIAGGREKNILLKIFEGKDVGTFFMPKKRKAKG